MTNDSKSSTPSNDTARTHVSARVLIVEDEPSLALTLRDRLVSSGYKVETCEDGETALVKGDQQPFDLIILDIMLPGIDGFEVCRELRRRGIQIPILMLTAKSQVVDKVVGLKLGADDYLTKPFDMMELLARVEALLRRGKASAPSGAGVVCFGDMRVDYRRAEVTRDGKVISLSAMEFRLLRYFLEHRRVVVSRDQLLDEVWGYESTPFSRTVDVHVASLRQKIEPSPSRPRYIVTVHRFGYRFDG